MVDIMEHLTDLDGNEVFQPYKYDQDIPSYGTVMTVLEFKHCCDVGGFTNYDGYGQLMLNNKVSDVVVVPSNRHLIPDDVTHVVWFNR